MIIFAYLQTSMLWVVNKQSNAPPAATGGREQIATERTI